VVGIDRYAAWITGIEAVMEKRRIAVNERARIDFLVFMAVVSLCVIYGLAVGSTVVGSTHGIRQMSLTFS
jgi:hypothetical protein